MLNSHCNICLTPVTFLERSGYAYPDKVAIEQTGRKLTFRELLLRSRRMASMLRDLGVCRGDRVLVLTHNCHQMIEAHFAIPGAAGIMVALNPWLSVEDLLRQIKFCDARVIMTQQDLIEEKQDLFLALDPSVAVVVLDANTHSDADHVIHFEYIQDQCCADVALDALIQSEQDPIAMNFTSGTTGEPKGVLFSHRAAYLHALGQVMMMGLDVHSNYFWSLPMFHVNGWGHMWAAVAIGAHQSVLNNRDGIDAANLGTILRQHSITHMAGAPRLVRYLGESDCASIDLFGLTVLTGGAAPTPELVNGMRQRQVRLIHQYGLNETCGPFVVCEEQAHWQTLPAEVQLQKRLRQGVPAIHVGRGVRVVDASMKDVAWDGKTHGEVLMRGNTVALGYFNNSEATQKAFGGGWFHSGDIAVIHPDGYLEIKDRIKDLIFVNTEYGWENISSIEIENVISGFPGIRDVAVLCVGIGEKTDCIVACYERDMPITIVTSELREFCQIKLPVYKRPVHFIEVELPKTATGKIKKGLLEDTIKLWFASHQPLADCV